MVLELGSHDSVLNPADRCLVVRVRSLLGRVLRRSVVPVREVRSLILVDVGSVLAISVVESERAHGLVDGDLVVVDTETRDLRVLVGEVSPREQRVVGEVDTGYDLQGTRGYKYRHLALHPWKRLRTWVVQKATCSVSDHKLDVSAALKYASIQPYSPAK